MKYSKKQILKFLLEDYALPILTPFIFSGIILAFVFWYSDYKQKQCDLLKCSNDVKPVFIQMKCFCVEEAK